MHQTPAILSPEKIVLHARPADKAAAIEAVGRLLVTSGHVTAEYVTAMFAREAIATTYLGNGVAVPHGTRDALAFVRSSGLAILHVPGGVDFGSGNIARLVIGLAARGDDHLDILTSLAEVCSDETRLEQLLASRSAAELITILQGGLPS
ncbi:MAG TPA: PTS sugar transporter subunit IIA [Lacunisphaera sp.]|jgi:PTS system mannitol-specific IIA component|nr:PTS sugar transporter subunit IIA [Lacunisphaera sp.]HQY05677.1 PTS sugar transporter subunit IIA [Lacunisphaera sp.]